MNKFYLLVLSLLSISTFAQNYDFTVYTPGNSGIVSNRIDDIKIDSGGLLWLSSYNGVSTFNGTTFTNYTTSNSALPTNAIFKIEIDNLNRKWMATQMNGIVLYNGTTWTNYTTANSGLPTNNIIDIAVDGLNNLWIATTMGLTKFNGTTWVTYTTSNSSIFSNNVNSVATDSSNNVFLTTVGALVKYNGSTFTVLNDGVSKILKIANGVIHTFNGDGYAKMSTAGVYIGNYWMGSTCLNDCNIHALDIDENSKVWIGFQQSCGTGGVQNFTDCNSYIATNSGLPDNNIVSLKVQSSNTIWAGTLEGGLVKMTLDTTPLAEPMEAAPNPTLPQAQAISMFSNVYSNVPVSTFLASWSDATLTNIQIVGNDTKKYTNCNYASIENITASTEINATGMTYLNFNVWTPDATFFNITLVDFGPNAVYNGVGEGDDKEHTLVYNGPTTGQWNTYHIPLSSFTNLTTRANIAQLIFSSSNSTLYIDNIYFSNGLVVPTGADVISPAPDPTLPQSQVMSMFSNVYTNLLVDTWRIYWSSTDLEEIQLSGNDTKKYSVLDYAAIETTTNPMNISDMGYINMDVYSPDFTVFKVKLVDLGPNGVFGGGDDVEGEVVFNAPAQNQWISYHIPISDFPGLTTKQQIAQLILSSSTAKVFLDNVYFSFENPATSLCFQSIAKGDGGQTVAIKADGSLWAWGYNDSGQLGDGTTIDRQIPTRIGNGNNWQSVAGGLNHTIAIKTDGTLWAWGDNNNGQLGDGTNIDRHVPTQIGTATNWKSIAGGNAHTVAIKADGSLWAWGANAVGQLGIGTTVSKNVPTHIGTGTNWKSVAAGDDFTLAIDNSGFLFGWGFNIVGQLGDSTNTNRNVPTFIGDAFQSVAAGYFHTVAVKTDGSLWTWGQNSFGVLGDGTIANRYVPTHIGTDTNWKSVVAGNNHTVGLKTDGTLWAWGYNSNGQLGDGTNTTRMTPTQISSGSDWQSVSVGDAHTFAIRNDGSLSTWGSNYFGELGDNTLIEKNAPLALACPVMLGVDNLEAAVTMTVYPNPVKDSFRVQNAGTVSMIKIYDLKGAVVRVINSNFDGAIDVSDLQSGMYLLKIEDNDGRFFSKRLIKE